jgi:hypothetical protein
VTLYERVEKLSDLDASRSTRRSLLGRAAKACLGLAVVAAGLSRADHARAGSSGCCVLAYGNDCPNCTGRGYDCGTGCTRWAWYCVDSLHRVWLCGECYAGGSCGGCSCGRVALTRGHGVPIPGGVGLP